MDGVVAHIRQSFLEYDTMIVYAQSEIRKKDAIMKKYSGSKSTSYTRRFLVAKSDKEQFVVFIQELKQARDRLYQDVNTILSKYTQIDGRIFWYYFIFHMSIENIAMLLKMDKRILKNTIAKLSCDFS